MKLRYLLFLSLALASLVPVVLFGFWPHSRALDNAIADVSERHLLLARNIGAALERYEQDVRAVFKLLAANAVRGVEVIGSNALLKNLRFRHICVATLEDGRVLHSLKNQVYPCPDRVPAERFAALKKIASTDKVTFSGVMPGPEGNPTLYLAWIVDGKLAIGAVTTDYIVEIGKAITFGERGHAAIVDHTGKAMAHPLPSWRRSMKDMTALGPVKNMINGETGVMIFYTPAMKGDVIAGYTFVPGPGWGVMIPQPFAELEKRAGEIRLYALAVIVSGVLVAAVLGWFLTGYLTKPVLAVVNAARRMAAGERSARVGVISKHAPEEFEILRKNFNSMADAIADSLNKLTRLAEAVSRIDGEDTFRQLIGNLVEISGADIALVGESLPDDDTRIRTLSFFIDGAEEPNTTYAIAGTPCEKVATGEDCVYASGVQDMFPDDPILKEWNIESYVGIPLLDTQQKVTGVIAILFRDPEEHIGVVHDLLRIMANRAESELNRQRVESERLQALFEAQQANRAKTDFLANMSHEFRTPLNSILGFSSILSSEMFGPHADGRYLEYAKNINESGAHLLEIITDILDISKIEAGEVTVEEIEIDLHNMLATCCSMVSQRARQADVTVELKKSKDMPKLLADERQVKQIVLNLLANAVKFTPPGGKVVISIGLNDKDEIGISITDTGIGIAAEDIPKILEPFGQVADIMSRHHGGTGLGLPICKSLIDLHGGRLEIESAIETGTTVTVLFPATRTSRPKV